MYANSNSSFPTRLFVFAAAAFFCFVLWASTVAQADEWYDRVTKALAESRVSGDLRLYNHSRIHDGGGPDNTNALAAGGDIFLETGSLGGFSTFFGLYTTNLIPTGVQVTETLVGHNHYLYALSQAYLQYRWNDVMVRGGRQLIDTPWARDDMFTMIPRAFNGVSVNLEPLSLLGICDSGRSTDDKDAGKSNPDNVVRFSPPFPPSPSPHLTIFAARMFQYQSRFVDFFTMGNDYSNSAETDGFQTIGLRYDQSFGSHHFSAQAWYYQFIDYGQLGYFETRYQSDDTSAIHPLFGLQYLVEGSSGDKELGSVHARVYGAMAGISFPHGNLCLVTNWSPAYYNSFRHGGIVHPYNDLSGTFFTDTMNNGIDDVGPGYAYGIKGQYRLMEERLTLSAGYVRYEVDYGFGGAAYDTDGAYGFPKGTPVKDQSQYGLDVGAAYQFKDGPLKGLIVQDTVGVRDFTKSPYGAYIENRFWLIRPF
jgi:hypothetical protein